jgi:CheY-like chemotaxis protein
MQLKRNRKTILVVEDEEPLIKIIKAKLENSGFGVITAKTARRALTNLQNEESVDAIWLDHYLLGEETGLDFLYRIKNSKVWKQIPVFVVSNTASADKLKIYIKLGATKYYIKAENRLDKIVEDINGSI